MNRRMKIVIGLSLVLLLAFGFVVIRTFVAKPQETVKIKPIPAGEYDRRSGARTTRCNTPAT